MTSTAAAPTRRSDESTSLSAPPRHMTPAAMTAPAMKMTGVGMARSGANQRLIAGPFSPSASVEDDGTIPLTAVATDRACDRAPTVRQRLLELAHHAPRRTAANRARAILPASPARRTGHQRQSA